MRRTFLPELAEQEGAQFKFVIGPAANPQQVETFAAEEAAHPGTFLQLSSPVRAPALRGPWMGSAAE